MADRYPLIYNPSANQIQELQSGDSLDVGSSLVKNATGYATSTGTSSQFLKADGSSDSNTYLTSSGTIALAQGLTGSPSITVGAVSGTTGTFSGAVSGTTGTFSGNVSAVNVSASSSVTATTFYGDGQNLTNTGSTLSASSGTQRVVLTGQTSGTMTASATDSDLTYDSSTNTLNVLNLNVQGTTTTIDTAVTEVDSLTVDGSVGIGTTGTPEKLTVKGDILIRPSNGNVNTSDLALKFGRTDSHDGDNQQKTAIIATPSGGGWGMHDLHFCLDSSTDLYNVEISDSKFVIKNSGNIGIGTQVPLHSLSVGDGTGDTRMFVRSNDSYGIGFQNGTNQIGGWIGSPAAQTLGFFHYDGTERLRINSSGNVGINSTAPSGRLDVGGNILPDADNTRDLGSSSKRWANIYTGDLNLSNEGSANDVDGTWGQYTIQEGEDDLFLINRRTGKKYKFNLTEVN